MPTCLEFTMKNNIFIFVLCFSSYFPKATTDSETVWMKDITARLQTDKRTLSDLDLPGQLSFLLKRKSHTLTLNLKRNYDIDPNADIYTVRTLNDGRSILEKTGNVEKEDVAYYQDRDNGAFMTARCVKRSNGQCDILINGNIRIGDKNYDLQPSKDAFTSRNFLEITGRLGKRYLLQDQSNIERDMPVQHAQFNIKTDQSFLQDQEHIERDMTVERKDKKKKEYYVKLLLLLDSSIWDLFVSTLKPSVPISKREHKARKNIRRYYSHILNGADEFYQRIDDPDIAINVKILGFVIYESETQFPHNVSKVHEVNGTKMINGSNYIKDISNLENSGALRQPLQYDEIMLFTRYWIYYKDMNASLGGIAVRGKVCVPGYRIGVVASSDYFRTTSSLAHELGHSLGAYHDGENDSLACDPKDGFLMSPKLYTFDPKSLYSKNPWLFSNCSVESFKKTLEEKKFCATTPPFYLPVDRDEWNKFMSKLPGVKYTPSMQCQLILGRGSKLCGVEDESICRFMTCWDPTTLKCNSAYFSAATGTSCGRNMWCKQGFCVEKDLK